MSSHPIISLQTRKQCLNDNLYQNYLEGNTSIIHGPGMNWFRLREEKWINLTDLNLNDNEWIKLIY
jgi:hypothetical protein